MYPLSRSSSHGSTSEMAAQLRYREPELRHGFSYEDNLHSDYPPDPEYYCEYIRSTYQSFLFCRMSISGFTIYH